MRITHTTRIHQLEKENERLKHEISVLEKALSLGTSCNILNRAVEFLLSQRDVRSDDVRYVLTGNRQAKEGEK